MKYVLGTIAALSLTPSVALADMPPEPRFVPVIEQESLGETPMRNSKLLNTWFEGAIHPGPRFRQFDNNRDGAIAFDELIRNQIRFDF